MLRLKPISLRDANEYVRKYTPNITSRLPVTSFPSAVKQTVSWSV